MCHHLPRRSAVFFEIGFCPRPPPPLCEWRSLRPLRRQRLTLLQHVLHRRVLQVGRVAMLSKQPPYVSPERTAENLRRSAARREGVRRNLLKHEEESASVRALALLAMESSLADGGR